MDLSAREGESDDDDDDDDASGNLDYEVDDQYDSYEVVGHQDGVGAGQLAQMVQDVNQSGTSDGYESNYDEDDEGQY